MEYWQTLKYHSRYYCQIPPQVMLLFVYNRSREIWNLEVVFMKGGKLENPEKNLQSREITKNKLNPQETLSTANEHRLQRREASAYPLPSMHPVLVVTVITLITLLSAIKWQKKVSEWKPCSFFPATEGVSISWFTMT